MTERIYYTEPSCTAFDAVITRSFAHDQRPAVVLDRTAFYPTSGGQPFDRGTLDRVAVVEAIDAGDDVVHVLASPLPEGSRVRGEIDWSRRLDHMQQHTGQHVLSAAFDRLFDNRTVSFHMGGETATIDLAHELTAAEIETAIDQANRVIWENRPVSIRFVSAEEGSQLPLRKEATREGTLRLIEIEDFDLSACGGTHVSRTGSIGVVAVLGVERFKGGSRVTFVCGGRAVGALRSYRDAVDGAVRVLSVLPTDLPSAVEKLQADAKALRKTVARQLESLAGYEAGRLRAEAAAALSQSAMTPDPILLVVQVLEGWDPAGLKAIASALVSPGRCVAALVSAMRPASIVIARSAKIPVDANAALRQLTERFGGRGGGKADLAQGGGLDDDPQQIAAAARDVLGRGFRF